MQYFGYLRRVGRWATSRGYLNSGVPHLRVLFETPTMIPV